ASARASSVEEGSTYVTVPVSEFALECLRFPGGGLRGGRARDRCRSLTLHHARPIICLALCGSDCSRDSRARAANASAKLSSLVMASSRDWQVGNCITHCLRKQDPLRLGKVQSGPLAPLCCCVTSPL